MKESKLGEHGLTGSHGFIAPGVHVCANYAANEGNVFVHIQPPPIFRPECDTVRWRKPEMDYAPA